MANILPPAHCHHLYHPMENSLFEITNAVLLRKRDTPNDCIYNSECFALTTVFCYMFLLVDMILSNKAL